MLSRPDEFRRQDQSSDSVNNRILERSNNCGKPIRVYHGIVVNVSDDLASRFREPSVARPIESGSLLADISKRRFGNDFIGFGADRRIVDNNYLVITVIDLGQRLQTAAKRVRSV